MWINNEFIMMFQHHASMIALSNACMMRLYIVKFVSTDVHIVITGQVIGSRVALHAMAGHKSAVLLIFKTYGAALQDPRYDCSCMHACMHAASCF